MSSYPAFLASKAVSAPRRGLLSVPPLAGHLRRFQADAVAFDLEVGSAGTFFATGLGKTMVGTEWARHAMEAAGKPALILTPLAVARQWETEGHRWGYDVKVIRSQADAGGALNVCNYDRLDKLDPDAFGPIVFDESSIVKAFMGKVSRSIIAAFANHPWRLGLSATPAPNDHTEIGQQAELLGIMPRMDMLARWFINDGSDSGAWRLKGHAEGAFYDWMSSWSRMAEHPRDMGDDVAGYDLPPLNIIRHQAREVDIEGAVGSMFPGASVSATTMHDVKRQTAEARAELAAEVVLREPGEPWVLWVDTDYEADAVADALPGVVEIRGSHPIERKEEALEAFAAGSIKWILTKGTIAGWGLNWQHCARQAFVGRSFSYELWHQMIRRSWRFGQLRDVDIHLIIAAGEDAIGRVVDRKTADNERMMTAMVAAMRRANGSASLVRKAYNPTCAGRLPAWLTGGRS